MSGIVTELLDSAMPLFERMAVTCNLLKTRKEQDRASILGAMEDAEAALSPLLSQAAGQFDIFATRVEKSIRTQSVAAGGAGGRSASRTPRTNRGVTPTSQKPGRARLDKASKPISKSKVLKKSKG